MGNVLERIYIIGVFYKSFHSELLVKVIEKWRSRDLAQCKLQPEKLNATSTFHSIDENGFYLKYGVQVSLQL